MRLFAYREPNNQRLQVMLGWVGVDPHHNYRVRIYLDWPHVLGCQVVLRSELGYYFHQDM